MQWITSYICFCIYKSIIKIIRIRLKRILFYILKNNYGKAPPILTLSRFIRASINQSPSLQLLWARRYRAIPCRSPLNHLRHRTTRFSHRSPSPPTAGWSPRLRCSFSTFGAVAKWGRTTLSFYMTRASDMVAPREASCVSSRVDHSDFDGIWILNAIFFMSS